MTQIPPAHKAIMEQTIFDKQTRLKAFPPCALAYIIYRRLLEHGVRATWLWIQDKLLRRTRGFSPPHISRVQPNLYVGGQHKRRGLAQMRALGITAVVNMREESDDAARGLDLDHYLRVSTTDDTSPSPEALKRGAEFIGQQITTERGVYIHCAAGVGRAPLMVAAYLVDTGMSAAQAWDTIRQARPFIRPTPPQITALDAFAAQYENSAQADAGSDETPTG